MVNGYGSTLVMCVVMNIQKMKAVVMSNNAMKYLIVLINGLTVWVTPKRVKWLQARGRILYIKEVKG
jgi:hypothetical protein